MKIQIGGKGDLRDVRVEVMLRKDNNTVYINGYMDYGCSERIQIEIDADTLALIVKTAVTGIYWAGHEAELST